MSKAELKRLERKRATLEAKLTTTSTFFNETKVSFEGYEAGVRSAALIEVQLRIDRLEEVFIQYEEIQSQIEALTNNFDQELVQRERFETSFYKLAAGMKQLIQENQTKDEENCNESRLSHDTRSNNNDQGINNQIRLPQINLPHFSGSYDSWLEFRDTFQSLIHDNEQVGRIQKFHYLRAALQGNAAQVIHAIEFTAANYKLAWDSLIERYDNTSVLINTHVKSLFTLPQLLKESSEELRSFVDQISKNLRSLEILGQPTNQWDTLLVYLVTSKLDSKTMREWEERKGNEVPTLEDMKKFLRNKADLLETLDLNKNIEKQKPQPQKSKAYLATAASKCPLCQQEHQLINCDKFLKLSPQQRFTETCKFKLCINCLKNGHFARECKSKFRCKKCKAAHNSLLHMNKETNHENEQETEARVKDTKEASPFAFKLSSASKLERVNHQILLSTALVQVTDASGRQQVCRALLDSGAQSNFISAEACKRLGLSRKPVTAAVSGISQTTLPIKQKCELRIQSQYNNFTQLISCLVIGSISEELPSEEVHNCDVCIPSYVKLADPTYNKPGKIDLILGAGIFWTLLCIGQQKVGKGSLLLQKTVLGWVMTGTTTGVQNLNKIACHFGRNIQIQNQLEQFWKIEESRLPETFTKEEKRCEDIFVKTLARTSEGRFVVTMPMKHDANRLGESRQIALRRLHSMERRLNKDPELKAMYIKFMQEYERLNHMSEMSPHANEVCNYLPHHAVKNESSSTTKLRVVFDGSAKTESGWSLNDLQFVGPTVQDDLWSIILRFRQHTFVICADIQKMYRQILIDAKQRNLQCILWRHNDNEEVKTFQLNTITYGTASAPYLATRCLRQLSEDHQATLPQASKIIRSDFYVDDMVTGSNSLQTLTQTINEVIIILQSAGMELRKWASNSDQLIKELQQDAASEVLEFGKNDHTKTLGIYWSSSSDVFSYNIGESAKVKTISKRMILSETAQIFDPLGLVSPCIIQAKILLQRLWLLKLSWDESVPQEIYTAWRQFRNQLTDLNYVKVPRHITVQDAKIIELHGFSDASQNAYGACIYVRTVTESGEVKVRLLTAKSKVAPLKALTIPRLELCAALVLAQLVQKIQASLSMTFHESYYWTDSSVVLHWLNTNSRQLQPFVSNRVSQIQEGTKIKDWSHIKTKDNPADFVSRGMNPSDLLKCNIWWHGPSWLMKPRENWPRTVLSFEEEPPETKKKVNVFMVKENEFKFPFQTFSDLMKMKRVMVYCIRYIRNCRLRTREVSTKQIGKTEEVKEAIRKARSISTEELEEATKSLVKLCQKEEFREEVKSLQQQKEFPKNCLQKLNPFLDSNEIMRVGGRIQLSHATIDQKHPILLPKNHRLTYLLIKHCHEQLLHAGAQATLYAVRERYWPIAGRNVTRRIIHSCITCYKTQPKSVNPIMGILPKARVTQAFPFENTGVDYAGPLLVKNREGRGVKTTKAYVCLFICMCTKAVHIELVSSLTKEAFLAALRRFASRRGKPRNIYSDNGTNFVAANKELAELLRVANQEIQTKLSTDGITWHFNPPYAPHFGGLWEAGVKSIKYHLKRVVGNSILTYENLQTVLIQIEGVLNSRPLIPLSNDPTDFQALTPAHFLIGKSLVSVVDPDTTHVRENRLSKFQHLQQIQQHFWARWNKEFISELQMRLKWRNQTTPLEEGALVIVKEDNSPPLHWHLGRVTKVITGPDGIPRVAELKTPHGIIKRAFSKICPLPMDKQ